jgi:hypothetical protein
MIFAQTRPVNLHIKGRQEVVHTILGGLLRARETTFLGRFGRWSIPVLRVVRRGGLNSRHD